jgi:hypothetical protein
MTDKPEPIWMDHEGNPHPIEVYLAPEYSRECLAICLQRTRRRAGKLLAELLKAIDQPAPEMARIRDLALGVEFETELAEEMGLALADEGRRSGF